MAITVLFVSGPRRGGKSTIIQEVIDRCTATGKRPHYIRLTSSQDDKHQPAAPAAAPATNCGVASAQWVEYDEDRVFELLPEVLGRLHIAHHGGLVILEAGGDPILRNAYPYDRRLFVMPAPQKTSEVFRSRTEANAAFHAALNDTAAFAREIFGLLENGDKFDDGGSEQRSGLTGRQLYGLINSPLGDELATRILLQPSHHGILEADLLVVNTAVGGPGDVVTRCVANLERVLDHVRRPGSQRPALVACDPANRDDPLREQMLCRVAELLACCDEDEISEG